MSAAISTPAAFVITAACIASTSPCRVVPVSVRIAFISAPLSFAVCAVLPTEYTLDKAEVANMCILSDAAIVNMPGSAASVTVLVAPT